MTDFKLFQSVDNSVRVSFFPFFLRCVFLYNPNFFQMLPTPPFRIFVIFFFLFCSGREEEEEEEDDDVCVCVYPISSVFYEGLRSSSSRPSLLRRLVIHSRGAHPTTTTRLFFFLFFSLCVQIEERKKLERERSFYFFSPLFIHLFMYTKYAPAFCWMPAEELVYYNVSVSASLSLSLCLCVAFHFNSR